MKRKVVASNVNVAPLETERVCSVTAADAGLSPDESMKTSSFLRKVLFVGLLFLLSSCAQKDMSKWTGEFQRDENGKPHGFYREVNAVGDTRASGMLEHGKMVGEWIYFSRGAKVAELEFKDGVLHGPCEMWYGSFLGGGRYAGRIKLRMTYEQGDLQGEMIRFYPDGSKKFVAEFSDGTPLKIQAWDANGKELSAKEASEGLAEALELDKEYIDDLLRLPGVPNATLAMVRLDPPEGSTVNAQTIIKATLEYRIENHGHKARKYYLAPLFQSREGGTFNAREHLTEETFLEGDSGTVEIAYQIHREWDNPRMSKRPIKLYYYVLLDRGNDSSKIVATAGPIEYQSQ